MLWNFSNKKHLLTLPHICTGYCESILGWTSLERSIMVTGPGSANGLRNNLKATTELHVTEKQMNYITLAVL